MGAVEWALLISLSMVWGGAFFFGEVALKELPPFVVAWCRVGLAAVALAVVALTFGHRLPMTLRGWAPFFVMGTLNNVIPFSLILWGQTHIAGGLAAILNATTPLFTVLVAHALTRDERLNATKGTGVLFGVAGVAVMIGTAGFDGFGSNVLAQLAILGAALSYAFAGIFGRRFRDKPPMVTASGQLAASTVLLMPIVLLFDAPWRLAVPSLEVLGSLAGLALLCTALAYVMFFRILARAGATNLSLVTFLIPPSAILLGGLFLGEVLELRHFAGLALIAIGLAFIDGRLFNRWTARRLQARSNP